MKNIIKKQHVHRPAGTQISYNEKKYKEITFCISWCDCGFCSFHHYLYFICTRCILNDIHNLHTKSFYCSDTSVSLLFLFYFITVLCAPLQA